MSPVINDIAKAVAAAGGRGLLVGGCVRDALWGRQPKDYDLEVYGLPAEKLAEVVATFGVVDDVGRSFGVLKLHVGDEVIDIALPRKDSKVSPGHKGFEIHGDPNLSFEEATRRRDFTVNAMLMDPLTGEVIDPWGGKKDAEEHILRVVNEKLFVDDPLRVLRAMQFVARFNLTVDPQSFQLMKGMAGTLTELPKERIGAEWRKLLLEADRPSLGMHLALDVGIVDALHPELRALKETPQEPEWHPEGDVFIHTAMVADEAANIRRRENLEGEDAWVLMLGAVCHDFGKPAVTQVIEGRIRSKGHEEAGEKPTRSFLKSLCVDHGVIDKVVGMVADHMKPFRYWDSEANNATPVTDGAIRRLATRIHPASMCDLVRVCEADYRGRGPFPDPAHPGEAVWHTEYPAGPWLLSRAERLGVSHEPPKHLIEGQELLDLGFTPGPEIGRLIRLADDLRDDKNMTKEEALKVLLSSRGA